MVFSSGIFLFAFLPVILFLYYNPLLKKIKCRNMVLLIASLVFYAWGEPIFVFLMIFSAFVNWKFGLMMEKNWENRKKILVAATFYNVALLFVFKYLTFFTQNLAWISGNDDLVINIPLPIGISFFTFQMMSYIFDIFMERAKVQKSFLNVLLYISMFPQLIAGPIVRYETVGRELQERKENFTDFSVGACRFVKGLCKKVLLANNIAVLADTVFAYDPATMSVFSAWIGAIAYTLQIYYDFSGYSDMAIGLGLMFGFHFEENFNRPYASRSVSEFWRRWHISMGTWFKDYVYIPLGGSRVTKSRNIFNLLVVWSLTGLWHGANWTFILWGLLYFVFISLEKVSGIEKKGLWIGHIYTLLLVVIGWVLFRSDTVGSAISYLLVMFGVTGNKLFDAAFISLVQQFGVLLVLGAVCSVLKVKENKNRLFQAGTVILYVLGFLAAVTFVIKGGYNPFIYFNF